MQNGTSDPEAVSVPCGKQGEKKRPSIFVETGNGIKVVCEVENQKSTPE
jgi:hypothetical protein